jgi:hypothetical protein
MRGSMLVVEGVPAEEAESMSLKFEMAMQDVPRSSSCSDHDGNHAEVAVVGNRDELAVG